MNRYSAQLLWSDEDQAFVATCPELGEVSAVGETREEALSELAVAVQLMLDYFSENGRQVPSADVVRPFSGQFIVRLPQYLHARLSAHAKRNKTSLNTLVAMYLAEASNQAYTLEYVGRRLQEFGYRAIAAAQEVSSLARGSRKILSYADHVDVGRALCGEAYLLENRTQIHASDIRHAGRVESSDEEVFA